jgi:dipeptidyl aminopeptidase/acylaminoacyl peptidase
MKRLLNVAGGLLGLLAVVALVVALALTFGGVRRGTEPAPQAFQSPIETPTLPPYPPPVTPTPPSPPATPTPLPYPPLDNSPLPLPTAMWATIAANPTRTITSFPTAIVTPAPTAMMVHSNAVAFIAGDWQYHRANSLWIANLDGNGEKQLLSGITQLDWSNFTHVAWSPNGEWLSVSRRGGLWVISPDGTNAREVVSRDKEKGSIISFAWSPDSTRIAFVQQRGYAQTAHLGIIDIDTDGTAYLTSFSTDFIAKLTWAPDGEWLAFTYGPYQIGAIHVSVGTIATLGTSPICDGSVESLEWSPDGSWLAHWRYGNGRYAHGSACISNVGGEDIHVDASGHSTNPVWEQDGRSVYVLATNFNPDDPNLDLDPRLLRFEIRERHLVRLASLKYGHLGAVETLAISPDGQWLSSLIGQRNEFIFQIVSLDGTTLIERPLELTIAYAPPFPVYAWSADSQHLVFVIDQRAGGQPFGYGSLYALDIYTGELTKLTEQHWIKAWAISPSSDHRQVFRSKNGV